MLLQGQRFVVTGIASKLSIAWAIAEALHREGASLILTYPNDKIKKRVDMAAEKFEADLVLECDVASDDSIAACFEQVTAHWGDGIDGVVHAIGFAPMDQLDGDFVSATTREGSHIAHDISSYSFVALAKAARELLAMRHGSMLTLTYEGSISVLPNYNVMGMAKASLEASVRYLATSMGGEGIRVNAISAGPIRTLAASGIKSKCSISVRRLHRFNVILIRWKLVMRLYFYSRHGPLVLLVRLCSLMQASIQLPSVSN